MSVSKLDVKDEILSSSNNLTNDKPESNPIEPPLQVDYSETTIISPNVHMSSIVETNDLTSENKNQSEEDYDVKNLYQGLHDKIDSLKEVYSKKLEEEIISVKNLFETKILIDKEKDNIIAMLSSELQDFRGDLRRKLLLPVLMQLIHEIDLIRQQLPFFEKDESDDRAEKILKYLSAIPDDLLEILRTQNVDEFTDESSNEFNPARQKAMSLIPTEDLEKNKCIAARVLPGYAFEEKIIRAEQVRVYTLK